MKILLLTSYFKPDLSAGSFRMSAFIDSFKEKLGPDDRIDIVTTMPNRYVTFTKECLEEEQLSHQIFVKRIKLRSHRSGFIDQAIVYSYYFFSVLKYIHNREYDYVFSTTGRLFTGFLGALISKYNKIPLYLDVRDIFTDTMDSLLPKKISIIFLPFFKQIEKFTLRQATKINMVSEGFKDYLTNIVDGIDCSYFTNGIDKVFYETEFVKPDRNGKTIITYAGNIGKGQGLEMIVPIMAEQLGEKYFFQIIGDGGVRSILESEIARRKIKNVIVMDPVDRDKLINIYCASDWLFLHLNDCDAFEKVLPSKIFEYAATGKPIIAGVAGFSAEFIEKNIIGSIVFKPCDINDFNNKFIDFDYNTYDRSIFINNFKREIIMSQMVEDVLAVGRSSS